MTSDSGICWKSISLQINFEYQANDHQIKGQDNDMSKAGRDRVLRRRIILIFLGAVMLPSLILAYLGLTYLRQIQKRQEQLVVQGLKGTLGNMARKIEKETHEAVLHNFDTIIAIASGFDNEMPWKIHHLISHNPLLDELFLIDRNGNLLYPRTFPVSKERVTINSILPATTWQYLTRGEEAEANGNFEDAVNYYTNGIEECRTSRERLAFMIRIARCLNKTGETDRAIRIYRNVIYEDADRFFGETVPYQFVASLQIARIMVNIGNYGEAFHGLSQLYGKMLDEFYRFDRQQFMYYLDRVRSEMLTILPDAGEDAPALLDSLRLTEKIYLEEPGRNDFLRRNILPSVEFISRSKPEADNLPRYARMENDPDSTIYVAFRNLKVKTYGETIVGAILNYPEIVKLARKVMKSLDTEEELYITILSDNGSAIQPDTGYIADEALLLLSGSIDDLTLAIGGSENFSLKEFTSKSLRLYYILIFTIILVIALGVIFILQDISREQELSRMKAEFISNITHEIKTPITTIRNLAENVNEGWVTSDEKQHDYFRIIAGESEKLGHLIEKTLDFSRIESGGKRYSMEPCSLNEVIEKTLKRFSILTAGQEIKMSLNLENDLPEVSIDRLAIEQALLNLLDNAIKYSPGKKNVRLTSISDGNYVKISVADSGIGVATRDRSRIFDKFYRSQTGEAMNIRGSGIGLTLVKEIVEVHGGIISLESKRNKGSTFTVRLPVILKNNGKDSTD